MSDKSIFMNKDFLTKALICISSVIQLISIPACKKYLDKKSDNTITSIERVEDLQAILDRQERINYDVVPSYMEVSADDYFLTDNDYLYNNGAGANGQAAYKWEFFKDGYQYQNGWSQAYVPINLANICLEWIDRFPRTQSNYDQWNNIKGSALFIRAFNFLNLSLTYAKAYDPIVSSQDLGIALRLTSDNNVPTVRASVAESYGQIIKDAKESLSYLPDISIHPLRPSKAAAYGLLARTYLAMRIYDSASLYADNCLKIRNELIDYNSDPDIVNSISGVNAPFRQFNKETIFYANLTTNSLSSLVTNGNVDSALYVAYANDDLRKTAFFYTGANSYEKFKGSYTQTTFSFFAGIATDEIYLIRAECFARKSDVSSAMADLNTLLKKRWKKTVSYIDVIAVDGDDALQKILLERRKELLFRGLRWMDIKRLNKEGVNIIPQRMISGQVYTLPPNSDRYALPVPQEIVDLAKVLQNPGWN